MPSSPLKSERSKERHRPESSSENTPDSPSGFFVPLHARRKKCFTEKSNKTVKELPVSVSIGLVGKPRAGKGTFVSSLEEVLRRQGGRRTIASVRFSDPIRRTLDIWGIPDSRENLQDVIVILEKRFGKGLLAQAIRKQAIALSADIVILDGVRWPQDEELVRSLPNNFMVFVDASPETRFQRAVEANEKAGDAGVSFEEFLRLDNAENERYVEDIGGRANLRIWNDDGFTLDDYRELVGRFYREQILPALKVD